MTQSILEVHTVIQGRLSYHRHNEEETMRHFRTARPSKLLLKTVNGHFVYICVCVCVFVCYLVNWHAFYSICLDKVCECVCECECVRDCVCVCVCICVCVRVCSCVCTCVIFRMVSTSDHHDYHDFQFRSEERRVGKECRSRWSA